MWAIAITRNKPSMKILARILLRKELGRDSTPQESLEAQEHREAKCKEITLEEIKEAYFFGSEVPSLLNTECIG